MALSNDLLSLFVKSTNDREDTKKESTVSGVVVDYNGSQYVKIDGSELLTPVTSTTDMKAGERVTVLIKDHTATVTGNVTSPSARTDDVKDLNSKVLEVELLLADKVSVEELEAEIAKIEIADIGELRADYAEFKEATIEDLEAINAEIENLDVKYAKVEDLDVEKARIDDLEVHSLRVDSGAFKDLQADVADIDTLIFGSASGTSIHTSFSNAVIAQLGNAQIKSAMIDSLSASKIAAGEISTNNVVVKSDDGRLIISDETIQISDQNRVRIQIGKDATNDYSINIWDADGNLMFSEGGITDNAIKDAIIRNDMVANNANISASKLDIDSLFEEINGSDKTIKSTKIYVDDKGQTLDIAFTSMTTAVENVTNTVNNLEIGVKNLLLKSGTQATNNNYRIKTYEMTSDIGINKDYTIVIKAKIDTNHILNGFMGQADKPCFGFDGTGEDRIYYTHFTTPSNAIVYPGQLLVYNRYKGGIGNEDGAEGTVYWACLYEGHVTPPMSWSAAPEDIERDISNLTTTVTTQGTAINVIQGQITNKIWQQDITTATDALGDNIENLETSYSEINQKIDGISSTVANHTTQIDKKADGSTVTEISNKITSMEQNLDGFKTTVSSTYVTRNESSFDKLGNLVKNGYGEYLNDSHFTGTTFTRGDCPEGCYGYFRSGKSAEPIPFDPLKKYDYEYWVRLNPTLTSGDTYFSIIPYDVDGNLIKPENVLMTYTNLFYLAQDLKPGDTVVYFEDLTNWGATSQSHQRSFIFFGYTDSTGYTYPDGTYSQYSYTDDIYTADTSVDTTNHTITLAAPWTGPTFTAGTCVGHATRGSTYCYYGQAGAISNKEWKKWSGVMQADPNGDQNSRRLAYAKHFTVSFYNAIANYAGVSIREQVIDSDARNSASAAQNTADEATERITESESVIEQLSDSIRWIITDENGQSIMDQTAEGWTFSMGGIISTLNNATNGLDDLGNKVSDNEAALDDLEKTVEDISNLTNYVKITTSGDQPCIELGSSGSDFKVEITNTEINFKEGTDTPAYINNQALNIKKAVVEEELQYGDFVWSVRDNGNMGLVWKGSGN